MPSKMIKNQQVVEDNWQLLDSEQTDIPEGAVIVPLRLWNEHKNQLAQHKHLGIWLNSNEPPSLIADSLEHFQLIAINFPGFADGRGFSYARELREQYGYQGEIRAIGDILRDQLYYLQRCGFNAFILQDDDPEQALASLDDFSDNYQSSMEQPKT